jgi:hypothetical protein
MGRSHFPLGVDEKTLTSLVGLDRLASRLHGTPGRRALPLRLAKGNMALKERHLPVRDMSLSYGGDRV